MESNRSVRGGRTRLLQEGDAFGTIAFFTGAEQMEARDGYFYVGGFGLRRCVEVGKRG